MKSFVLKKAVIAALIAVAVATGSQAPLGTIENSSGTAASSELLQFHKALVEHESITGNEENVATFLISYLESKNYTVETQEVKNPKYPALRRNVFAYPGGKRESRTLVTSHIDTVPPYWPYERRDDGSIWGRGSVDAKASVAAQITAVNELLADGEVSPGDVALLFVVGEETSGDGMKKANDLGLSWDTVIFGEPTELKLAAGHKGMLGFGLTAHGKAGHSGYPELGRNANALLVEVLHALAKTELPWSEKFGNTTLNLGMMSGGVAANVIAETATASIAIRIADGTPDDLAKSLTKIIEEVGEGYVDIERSISGYGPVDIDADIEGFDTIIVNYGTDVPNLQGDHKRYLYGPGNILVAHSDHENLFPEDLQKAVDGYKIIIKKSLE